MQFLHGSFFLAVLSILQLGFANPIIGDARDVRERMTGDEHVQWKRTEFPDYPPSCKLCERNYDQISSCANASVVFAQPAAILYNPLYFLDVIECACADTFYSTYPQCVDCFNYTNQTAFLEPDNGNLTSVVVGIRQICALGSSIFGHVASHNSQLPGQTPITVPSEGAALRRVSSFMLDSSGIVVALFTVVLGFFTGIWTVL